MIKNDKMLIRCMKCGESMDYKRQTEHRCKVRDVKYVTNELRVDPFEMVGGGLSLKDGE